MEKMGQPCWSSRTARGEMQTLLLRWSSGKHGRPNCQQPIPILVGGIPTPPKNISQLGSLFPNIWKNKKCSKPQTRQISICVWRSSPSRKIWSCDCGLNIPNLDIHGHQTQYLARRSTPLGRQISKDRIWCIWQFLGSIFPLSVPI
jgi:hypothetical protein